MIGIELGVAMSGHAALIAHLELNGNGTNEVSGFTSEIFGTTPVTDRFGRANSAVRFSGVTTDYVKVNQLQLGKTYSISAWFRIDTNTPQLSFLFGKGPSAVELQLSGNLVQFMPEGNNEDNNHWSDVADALVIGWNHVVVTFDEVTETSLIYINNGNPITKTKAGVPNSPPLGDFYIGKRGNDTYAFTGDIDDVRIFDNVLNSKDVNTLHKATIP
jgi:Concanavalin A-like lectin/glucanases superfamily